MLGYRPTLYMRSVGTANAAPETKVTGRLTVGELRSGEEFSLPVTVINGSSPGKTLYIQAASDGDELNGIGVIQRIVPTLDPAELSGTVIIVGLVNYHAFQVGEHRNPIDDQKLNRTYPGDPEGTSSERLAAATFDIAAEADLILDLHQGSTSRMITETRVRCGRHHRRHSDCLELARVFDCGHIFDQKGPKGQLARVAVDKGIPTIDPELGGAVGWDEESIRTGVQGIFNVLKYYGFLEGSVEPRTQTRATGFDYYFAPVGGLVDFTATLGEPLTVGDPIFTVTDIFGTEKATVTADNDGVFWRTRRRPQVATGEYVCSVGTPIA